MKKPVKRKKPENISKKDKIIENKFINLSGKIPYFAQVKENSKMFKILKIPEYINKIPKKICKIFIHILLKRNFFTG